MRRQTHYLGIFFFVFDALARAFLPCPSSFTPVTDCWVAVGVARPPAVFVFPCESPSLATSSRVSYDFCTDLLRNDSEAHHDASKQ